MDFESTNRSQKQKCLGLRSSKFFTSISIYIETNVWTYLLFNDFNSYVRF